MTKAILQLPMEEHVTREELQFCTLQELKVGLTRDLASVQSCLLSQALLALAEKSKNIPPCHQLSGTCISEAGCHV